MKNSIEEYREAVKELALQKDALVFENDGIQHAAIVNSAIFNNAENIRIYSNKMSGSFSTLPEYMESMYNLILSGRSIKVIVDSSETIENKTNSFIKCLRSKIGEIPDNFQMRKANKQFAEQITSLSPIKSLHHFTTGDERMFRLETNNQTHTAFVSFNRPQLVKVLNSIFDSNFNNCEPISF